MVLLVAGIHTTLDWGCLLQCLLQLDGRIAVVEAILGLGTMDSSETIQGCGDDWAVTKEYWAVTNGGVSR